MSNSNFTLTVSDNVRIFQLMKWNVFIVLFAVLVGVVVPPSLPLIASSGEQASLGKLDVCHSATPALSSNGEMPCVHMTANGIIPEMTVSVLIAAYPVFPELILATRNEQPPQS